MDIISFLRTTHAINVTGLCKAVGITVTKLRMAVKGVEHKSGHSYNLTDEEIVKIVLAFRTLRDLLDRVVDEEEKIYILRNKPYKDYNELGADLNRPRIYIERKARKVFKEHQGTFPTHKTGYQTKKGKGDKKPA